MLVHHLKARTIKDNKKESDFDGYGMVFLSLVINKLLYYCLYLGFTNIKFPILSWLEPKAINWVLWEFPFRANAIAPFESKDNKER
jgi:hypothetical protein